MRIDTIGEFDVIPDSMPAEGDLFVRVKPIDLITYWQRCGIMADFVASFYAFTQEHPVVQENIISTIVNELIENATKYSVKRDRDVRIHMKLYDTVLKIQTENYAPKLHFQKLKQHLKSLTEAEDLDEFYFETLTSKPAESSDSGIGLLLLLKDYDIKIGAQFQYIEDIGQYKVTIQTYYYIEQ